MNYISKGAEAILYKNGNKLIKKRIKKGYRIKEIDEKLRRERTNREVRLLTEAKRNGINVPAVIEKDIKEAKIIMEFIDGNTLRDVFDKLDKTTFKKVCSEIGEFITKLHEKGIVHGDLTTSNMILRNETLYFIDFGLGKFSKKVEDFAVDLHLLKEALVAKHNKISEKAFSEIIKNYNPSQKEKILRRLNEIEKRGRYSKRD